MSKSLGSLTLDLIAKTGNFTGPMDKAARNARKNNRQMQRDFNKTADVVKKAAAVIGVSLTASAFTSFIRGAADTAASALDVAEKLGTTTESLSKLRYATEQSSGMMSGEFDTALQRMTRRLAEAAQGGGVAKEAIEELGLSAKDLANSDPADAFKQIIEQMSKLPTQSDRVRMAFKFFDSGGVKLAQTAIAGADGIEQLSQQLESMGGVIGTKTAQQAAEFNAKITEMQARMSGVGMTLASDALPYLDEFVDIFNDPETVANISAIGVALVQLGGVAVNVASEFGDLINKVGHFGRWMSGDLTRLDTLQRKLKDIDRSLTGTGLNATLGGMWYSQDELQAQRAEVVKSIEEIESLQSLLDDIAGGSSTPTTLPTIEVNAPAIEGATKAIKAARDANEDLVRSLQLQAATLGMTKTEAQLYKLQLDGATQAQLAAAHTALAMIDAYKQQEDYSSLVSELRTEEEKLTDQLHERLAVMDAIADLSDEERSKTLDRITDEAFQPAPDGYDMPYEIGGAFGELDKIEEERERLEEWYELQLEMLEDARERRADLNATWDEKEEQLKQEHEDKLERIEKARRVTTMKAGEEYFGNMASATKAFFGEQSGMYKAAFAMEKAFAIGKILLNAPSSFSKAFDATVGIPFVGPALAPVAGAAAVAAQLAQAAAAGGVSLSGMAHDGIDSIPEDGTWLLQKGERVTTADTSAKLDRTLDKVQQDQRRSHGGVIVNLIEDSSRAGEVEQTEDEDGNTEINAFVSDIMSGGDRAQAIEQAYGLERRGT